MEEAECHTIVARKLNTDNFTILNFQQCAFEQIGDYLGVHSSLKVTITHRGNEETHHFFLKTLPKVPSQRNFFLDINGFFKEKQFFNRYCASLKEYSIGVLDDAIPKCFLTKNEALVFDNLEKRGYITFPSRTSLEMDCVKSALATLAKLHSSCLILEEMKSFKLMDEFEAELAETLYSDKLSVKHAWESSKMEVRTLIDITHDDKMKLSKDEFKERAIQGLDHQKVFATPSTKFRNTICHGEPGTKNFMFNFDNQQVRCVVVDFQTYRYSPPAQDIMAFIYLTTDRIVHSSLEDLLHFYYQELDGNLGKFGYNGLISQQEFFESCRYYKQFALVQRITYFPVVINYMADEIMDVFMADPHNNHSGMFENNYEFMVMACRKDPVFRKMNLEAIEDLGRFFEENLGHSS